MRNQTRQRLLELFEGFTERIVGGDSDDESLLERFASSILEGALGLFAPVVASAVEDALESQLEGIAPPLLREITGLPVDRLGFVQPRYDPADTIRVAADNERSLTSAMSPLVTVPGPYRMHEDSNPLEDFIDVTEVEREVERHVETEVSAPVVERLQNSVTRNILDRAVSIFEMLRDAVFPRAEARERVEEIKEKSFNSIENELEHEYQRSVNYAKELLREGELKDLIAGYVLHSVKQDNSDPVHVANDGTIYMRDDGPPSNAKWADRLVPPYRKNCKCFTIEIYRDAQGDHHFVEWDAAPRISGSRTMEPGDVGATFWDGEQMRQVTPEDVGQTFGREDAIAIQPRDVNSYSDWFNAQRDGNKVRVMGQQRVSAVQLTRPDGSAIRYEDFVKQDGSIMSPAEILAESDRQRSVRRSVVRQMMEREHREHLEAWEVSGDRWEFTRFDESQNLERVRVLFQNQP